MKRLLAALLLVTGGGASYAQIEGTFAGISDTGTAGGEIEAEVVQQGAHDPWHAYEDVDGDGRFTEGVDVEIPDSEILDGTYSVQKAQHGLVIPKSVGPVDVPGEIRFEAGNQGHLTVAVRLTAGTSLSLSAGADAQLGGLVAEATSAITVEATGVARLSDAYLRSTASDITVTGDEGIDGLHLRAEAGGDVALDAKKGNIGLVGTSLHADGHLTADANKGLVNADRTSMNATGPLSLTAGSDVRVKQATLATSDDIVLTAGKHKDTIFVQDARFADANDVAQAAPDRVEIVGTPAEGDITHAG